MGDYLGSRPDCLLFIFCLGGNYGCGYKEGWKSERVWEVYGGEVVIKYTVEAKILDKVDGSIYYKTIGVEAAPDQGYAAMDMARRIFMRERGKGEIFIARLQVVSIEDKSEQSEEQKEDVELWTLTNVIGS